MKATTQLLKELKGEWDQVINNLLQQYDELNEEDLQYREGEEEKVLMTLKNKLNVSDDDLLAIIKENTEENTTVREDHWIGEDQTKKRSFSDENIRSENEKSGVEKKPGR